MKHQAFFLPEGDRFVPTDWTRGPWDPRYQHAGPPAALLGRAIEQQEPVIELQVARFTLEVLRPIPLKPLTVESGAVRSGRRTQFCVATLFDDDGEVARASAWRIRGSGVEGGTLLGTGAEITPHPGPHQCPEAPVFDPWDGPSYFSAMEWRLARGGFVEPGPAAAWMRMKVGLVAGEAPSPLSRVLASADSGSGISMELPIDRFVFINTELSVHLFRLPRGEWVCLDARSRIDPSGIGLAESVLWDEDGRLGQGAQSLLVAPR